MYIKHQIPDKEITLTSDAVVCPIITLSNQHNNKIHIIIDDGCYVCLRQLTNGKHRMTNWWPKEAGNALASYINEQNLLASVF